ncbi:RNA methyltransferase substrate-binding domain-containing protein, partial [Cronobacter sakazakii]
MSSEYIIGRNPVIEALRAGRDINKILVAEGSARGQVHVVLALGIENEVILQHAPKKKLDQLVEGNHQGVIAQVAAYQYAELEDLFKLAEKRNEDPFF